MMRVLGFDTSNYTTSVAVFDGERGLNVSRLLDVENGSLGLRQRMPSLPISNACRN